MLNDIVLIVAIFLLLCWTAPLFIPWKYFLQFFFFLSADKFGWPWLKIDEMIKPGKEYTVMWG
jgi:hypothetical protein